MYWLAVAVGFVGSLLGVIYLFRYLFAKEEEKFRSGKGMDQVSFYEKKAPTLETGRYSGMFKGLIGNIALIIALGVTLAAFEWRQYDQIQTGTDLQMASVEDEEIMEIPITEFTPPPPQPIQQPEIEEVPDEEEIVEEVEVEMEVELDEEVEVKDQYTGPTMVGGTGNPDDFIDEPAEQVDEVFLVAEEDAEFPGGFAAWMKYLQENIKYPRKARQMQVEGKVFVEFTIEKNGNVTDVKVVRGQGYGLDDEAKRVVQSSPKWKPAKQRGRSVRLRKVLPVSFRLK